MTDPLFIDAAYTPHKHRVKTRWDDNWFYVESKGIPDHIMMKGITSWQQQVPLPQCCVGNNAWQIPLKYTEKKFVRICWKSIYYIINLLIYWIVPF